MKSFQIYFSDSDSDSQSNAKPTDTSTRPVQSGFSGKSKPPSKSMSGAATVPDKPTYKTSNQSSPSRPRTHVRYFISWFLVKRQVLNTPKITY